MAMIKLVLEDVGEGKVKVTSMPSFSDLMKIAKLSGRERLTGAEGYALLAITTIHRASKVPRARQEKRIWSPVQDA